MKRLEQLLHLTRARRLSLFAAFMAFFLFATEPTYAAGTVQAYVTIPNTTPAPTPELPVDPNPNSPASIELDAVTAVDANEIALVSIAARRVESARIPDGARLIAKDMVLNQFGWSSSQFSCLDKLWTKESNWRYQARNKSSGAHGIAQALPATKMEVIGTDWRTNPITQISWGLKYISERYDTPCLAYKKFKRSHWY